VGSLRSRRRSRKRAISSKGQKTEACEVVLRNPWCLMGGTSAQRDVVVFPVASGAAIFQEIGPCEAM